MAPISLMNAYEQTSNSTRHRPSKIWTQRPASPNQDLQEEIDATTIDNKIDFFRFMGLEIAKVSDKSCDSYDNECRKMDKRESLKRIRKSSAVISDSSHDGENENNFDCQYPSKRHCNNKNRRIEDTIDYYKILTLVKECRVVIRGEKCHICGKTFKCIKDVQVHVKKKHRRKKTRAKVVLKIGNEVISRVAIRRKYLKRAANLEEEEEDRTIVDNKDVESCKNICLNDPVEIVDARSETSIIDLDDTDHGSNSIPKGDLLLSPLGDIQNGSRNDDNDEDVREVLRITRSRKSVSSINHETPNRMERELLLSDAIREFDRIDHDPMDLISFADEYEHVPDDNNEDYCWMGDETVQNPHLDLAENNCSFHIQNDYDIDFTLEGTESSMRFDPKYFDDENASIHSLKGYRNENNDVPDFIDYAQCLEGNNANNNNNTKNNNYGLESSFYNEGRITECNQLLQMSKAIASDNRNRARRHSDVLIKEEIILEDLP